MVEIKYTEYTCSCDDKHLKSNEKGDSLLVVCGKCNYSSERVDCPECGSEYSHLVHPRKGGGECQECDHNNVGAGL